MSKDLAFPSWPTGYEPANGLTKRELFAAMAMQGILMQERPSFSSTTESMANVSAAEAVKCADALLAELAKPVELPLDVNGRVVA